MVPPLGRLAAEVAGESVAAAKQYVSAANVRVELGRPQVVAGVVAAGVKVIPGPQARRFAQMYKEKKAPQLLKRVAKITSDLQYGTDTAPAEEALRDLGELLGFLAIRPDKNMKGSGTDVLWRLPEEKGGAALEAKIDKKPTSQYQKTEIEQYHDLMEWLQTNYPDETFVQAMVGYKLPVAKQSNPPGDLRVIPLEQFTGLAERVRQALEFIEAVAHSDDVSICSQRAFKQFGLCWPDCIDSLSSSLAIDLKNFDPSLQGDDD